MVMLMLNRARSAAAVGLAAATCVACLGLAGCASQGTGSAQTRTIVFVWDGLRPDSVSAADTPNLWALKQKGVWFADNHSTYPTFTMMNASSLATGSFPATAGFYGNWLWQPGPTGSSFNGVKADFNQPAYTEDWGILDALNSYYNNQLFLVGTLFQAAQAKGLVTATVGKSGASYIQDFKRGGYILDENLAAPASLAIELQAAGFALPKNTPNGHPAGVLKLAPDNGDPTAQVPAVNVSWPNGLKNADPTDASGARATAANAFMMKAYLDYILPNKKPDLSLIWFRDPDSTEHAYGPGSANYHLALRAQDQRLGELLARLKELGLDGSTNLVVVSDHGHSSVSGDPALFPLRAIANGAVGRPDPAGYSTSGDVRTADLIARANLGIQAFDGVGCMNSAMAGLKADGQPVYPMRKDDDGKVCGKAGTPYQTGSFTVPATLPPNAVVIATNGGSDYIYVPSHDPALVQRLVRFLQTRSEYGAILLASRYGPVAGTVPMNQVRLEGTADRNPDLMVSFDFDPKVAIAGMPGILYESFGNNRGMHGSFSPIDVHNTLLMTGPGFKAGTVSSTASGNVDVAPTLAYLLGTALPHADGRVLAEALRAPPSGAAVVDSTSGRMQLASPTASGFSFALPTDPDGRDIDRRKTGNYAVEVSVKDVRTADGKSYRYFDSAKATRQ